MISPIRGRPSVSNTPRMSNTSRLSNTPRVSNTPRQLNNANFNYNERNELNRSITERNRSINGRPSQMNHVLNASFDRSENPKLSNRSNIQNNMTRSDLNSTLFNIDLRELNSSSNIRGRPSRSPYKNIENYSEKISVRSVSNLKGRSSKSPSNIRTMQTNLNNPAKLIDTRNENTSPIKGYSRDSLKLSTLSKSFIEMSKVDSSILERSIIIGRPSAHAGTKVSLNLKQSLINSHSQKELKNDVTIVKNQEIAEFQRKLPKTLEKTLIFDPSQINKNENNKKTKQQYMLLNIDHISDINIINNNSIITVNNDYEMLPKSSNLVERKNPEKKDDKIEIKSKFNKNSKQIQNKEMLLNNLFFKNQQIEIQSDKKNYPYFFIEDDHEIINNFSQRKEEPLDQKLKKRKIHIQNSLNQDIQIHDLQKEYNFIDTENQKPINTKENQKPVKNEEKIVKDQFNQEPIKKTLLGNFRKSKKQYLKIS